MLKGIAQTLLILCAVNFIALLAAAGALFATGNVGKQTLYDVVHVGRGTHRALSREAIADFERMRRENETYADMFTKLKGSGEVYQKSVIAGAPEMRATQEETERVLTQRLETARKALEDERSRIQTLMQQEQELREEIVRLKADAVAKAAAENTAAFNSIVQGLDAEDAARVLSRMFLEGPREDAERAVQWLRNWKRKFSSDVLTEMDPASRQLAVRMLEDDFADIPPENIALRWQREKTPVPEMVQHLRTMPVTKALRVIRRLDRNIQDDLWESFAPLQPGGG